MNGIAPWPTTSFTFVRLNGLLSGYAQSWYHITIAGGVFTRAMN